MFYDEYIKCCARLNESASAVAVAAKISKPSVNRWKKGSVPSDFTKRKLYDYFCSHGLSPSLLGFLMPNESDDNAQVTTPTSTKKEPPRERRDGFDPQFTPVVKFALFGDAAAEITEDDLDDLRTAIDAIIASKDKNKD